MEFDKKEGAEVYAEDDVVTLEQSDQVPPVDFDIIKMEPTRPLLDNVPSNANFKLSQGQGQRTVAG